jgi:hypothetical protein
MNLDHVFVELALSEDNIAAASVTGMAAVRTDRKGKVLAAYSEAWIGRYRHRSRV